MSFSTHCHFGSPSTIAWLCVVLIGCSSTDSNSNLRGNVTLDSEIIQGVTIRVEDDAGNESETTTDGFDTFGRCL